VPRFVIQEHYARSHHFDLRLKHDGVLASRAVPKGMPADPSKNRLAVRVEDHALLHLNYTDDTPVGEGDAVRVRIWDEGPYTSHEFGEDMVIATLHGRRITGRHATFRTDGKNWLIHQMNSAPEPSPE
jgi:bifunctional non-homologous end joining protein LigD